MRSVVVVGGDVVGTLFEFKPGLTTGLTLNSNSIHYPLHGTPLAHLVT